MEESGEVVSVGGSGVTASQRGHKRNVTQDHSQPPVPFIPYVVVAGGYRGGKRAHMRSRRFFGG